MSLSGYCLRVSVYRTGTPFAITPVQIVDEGSEMKSRDPLEVIEMSETRTTEKDAIGLSRTVVGGQSEGLCVTCEYAPSCAFMKMNSQPVMFCEEFREGTKPDVASAGNIRQRATDFQVDFTLKGLCMNCDNHGDCVHEKPFGGVWECENYS